MATFGLWYFKWNGSSYESRLKLTLGGGTATVQDFKNRGFDYAVILGNSGLDIQYTGDGQLDGESFAEDVFRKVSGISLYITIPYYQYQSSEPRDNPRGSYKYWSDWIDAIVNFASSDLMGFYWGLESAWMFKNYYRNIDPQINPQTIEILADKIHSYGLKFIWIPSANTLELQNTDIFDASEYFDYIFVQPNYYMKRNGNQNLPTYEDFKQYISRLETLKSQYNTPSVYLEMEADECTVGGCGNCRECSSQEYCKELAKQYIEVQMDVLGGKYPHRAYYFGVTLEVIDKVNQHCQNTLGERYV